MKRQRVVTFYSYKGGVGRSLAVVNAGYELAQRGQKVLLMDFDFEAPGLHEMEIFRQLSNSETIAEASRNKKNKTSEIAFTSRAPVGGAIGLLNLYKQHYETTVGDDGASPDWRLEDYMVQASVPSLDDLSPEKESRSGKPVSIDAKHPDETDKSIPGQLWLLPAGQVFDLAAYRQSLVNFDPTLPMTENGQLVYLGGLAWNDITAKMWEAGFDWILIDARTGLSDPFYQALNLCDTVVMLGGYTRQNVKGLRTVWNLLQEKAVEPSIGEKRIVFVGTPEPNIDPIRKKQWRARLALEDWPDFPEYDLELPYVAELALEETNFSLPWYAHDSRFEVRQYRDAIGRLVSRMQDIWNVKTPQREANVPAMSNPFELLRSDYISMQQLQQYFIDPGARIHRSLAEFMPMVITGARGSGKTMLARYFGFERRLAELPDGEKATPAHAEKFIGIYLRLDVDILNAFTTSTLDRQKIYDELFSQFLDILVIRKALNSLQSFGGIDYWCNSKDLFFCLFREFGATNKGYSLNLDAFLDFLDAQLSEIRYYLRNPAKVEVPSLIQGNILLKLLVEHLTHRPDNPFEKHFFAIIVDEFEHFAKFQQRVVNTRIKQIRESDRVTYRIFTRHNGLKTTETLAENQLIQPIHDFKYLDLDEEREFSEIEVHFSHVANKYLEKNAFFANLGLTEIDRLFERLGAEEEARLIAGNRGDKPLQEWVEKYFPSDSTAVKEWFGRTPSLHIKAVAVVIMNQGQASYRAKEKSPSRVMEEFAADSPKSREWLHNYGQGALYWLCSLYHKNKIYAGLNSILLISGNNIRTFLELCRGVTEDWLSTVKVGEPLSLPISVKIQAKSLAKSAENYRSLLRSLPCHSRELMNFVDRLGRLLEHLNKTSTQSEPEINHFSLSQDAQRGEGGKEWTDWFEHAYSESVILRLTSNKQKGDSDIRGDDWRLNPCYAPYYQYSPRRKKKMRPLADEDLRILFSGDKDEYTAWFQGWIVGKSKAAYGDKMSKDLFDE